MLYFGGSFEHKREINEEYVLIPGYYFCSEIQQFFVG